MKLFAFLFVLFAFPVAAQVPDFKDVGSAVSAEASIIDPAWRLYGVEVLSSQNDGAFVVQEFRAVFEARSERFVFPPEEINEYMIITPLMKAGEQVEVSGTVVFESGEEGWQGFVDFSNPSVLRRGISFEAVSELNPGSVVLIAGSSEAQTVLRRFEDEIEREAEIQEQERVEAVMLEERIALVEERFAGDWAGKLTCGRDFVGEVSMDFSPVRDTGDVFGILRHKSVVNLNGPEGVTFLRFSDSDDFSQMEAVGSQVFDAQIYGINIDQVVLTSIESGYRGHVNLGSCDMTLMPKPIYEEQRQADENLVLSMISALPERVAMSVGSTSAVGRIDARTVLGVEGYVMFDKAVRFSLTFPTGVQHPVFKIEPFPMGGAGYGACVSDMKVGIDLSARLVVLETGRDDCDRAEIRFQ